MNSLIEIKGFDMTENFFSLKVKKRLKKLRNLNPIQPRLEGTMFLSVKLHQLLECKFTFDYDIIMQPIAVLSFRY